MAVAGNSQARIGGKKKAHCPKPAFPFVVPLKFRKMESHTNRTGNDMSVSTATLTLMLLATVAAVHSEQPTFWLSIGPAPLAAGLGAFTFFRRKYSRRQDRSGANRRRLNLILAER